MDRKTQAVYRLWGKLKEGGRLHQSPSFAEELAAHCHDNLELQFPGVSRWSLGKHLEHLYLSSHYVLDRLEESMSGANWAERMGLYGRSLMLAGFLPRGVFRTIPPLQPSGGSIEAIRALKNSLDRRLEKINWDLDNINASVGRSRHPRMKYLTASEWLFFADIHHRHHLAIIRDILRGHAAIPARLLARGSGLI
jgi:hypothetical protein